MKAVLIAMASMAATPASAERWALIASNAEAQNASALNLDSIRDVGSYKRGWVMMMLAKAPNGKPAYTQTLNEFDCGQQRVQVLAQTFYDETGNQILDTGAEPWTFAVPGTPLYTEMMTACGTKVPEDQVANLTAHGFFKRFLAIMRNNASKK